MDFTSEYYLKKEPLLSKLEKLIFATNDEYLANWTGQKKLKTKKLSIPFGYTAICRQS